MKMKVSVMLATFANQAMYAVSRIACLKIKSRLFYGCVQLRESRILSYSRFNVRNLRITVNL